MMMTHKVNILPSDNVFVVRAHFRCEPQSTGKITSQVDTFASKDSAMELVEHWKTSDRVTSVEMSHVLYQFGTK